MAEFLEAKAFSDYAEKALSFANLTKPTADLMVEAALGITGEGGEVVEVLISEPDWEDFETTLKEEIGDQAWYINLLLFCFDATWGDALLASPAYSSEVTLTGAALILSVEGGKVADIVKKHVAYGKQVDTHTVHEHLGRLISGLSVMLELTSMTWEEVLEANVRKLTARFGTTGFDPSRAVNRDTAAEAAALQG